MSSETACVDVRALAPELALGVADGHERERALRHVDGCQACGGVVSGLATAADGLLLLAPRIDPPFGFRSRTLARIARPERRGRPSRWLAVAAAIVAAIAIGAGATARVTAGDRALGGSYRTILSEGAGAFFAVAPVEGAAGRVGTAWGYQGQPSWLFVSLHPNVPAGDYRVSMVTSDAQTIELGIARIDPAHATWGAAIPVDLTTVRELRFARTDGSGGFTAMFDPQSPWG